MIDNFGKLWNNFICLLSVLKIFISRIFRFSILFCRFFFRWYLILNNFSQVSQGLKKCYLKKKRERKRENIAILIILCKKQQIFDNFSTFKDFLRLFK